MPNYVKVTIQQMRELLKVEKGWVESVASGREYVFTYALPKRPGYVIKVWSSVHELSGLRLGEFMDIAAKRGGDSIKVCVVDVINDKGIAKTPRIHRVPNWQDRVRERVIQLIRQFDHSPSS